MNAENKPNDTSATIASIITHLHNLLRKEVALLKTEMSERVNHAALAVGLIGLALVLIVTGLQVTTAAAIAALVAAGLSPAWAAVSIAAGCFVIAAALGLKAMRMLKAASLVPHDTIEAIQKDAAILKETYND